MSIAATHNEDNSETHVFKEGKSLQKLKTKTTSPNVDVGRHLMKTKICTLFMNGRCHYGANRCFYAHSVDELRDQPQLAKTSLCSLYKKGRCNMGDRCRYAHNVSEMNESAKRVQCLWFMNGHCSHGNGCRFSHSDFIPRGYSQESSKPSTATTSPKSSSPLSANIIPPQSYEFEHESLSSSLVEMFGASPIDSCPHCGSSIACICRIFEECTELLKLL
jgi:hypothetical protein